MVTKITTISLPNNPYKKNIRPLQHSPKTSQIRIQSTRERTKFPHDLNYLPPEMAQDIAQYVDSIRHGRFEEQRYFLSEKGPDGKKINIAYSFLPESEDDPIRALLISSPEHLVKAIQNPNFYTILEGPLGTLKITSTKDAKNKIKPSEMIDWWNKLRGKKYNTNFAKYLNTLLSEITANQDAFSIATQIHQKLANKYGYKIELKQNDVTAALKKISEKKKEINFDLLQDLLEKEPFNPKLHKYLETLINQKEKNMGNNSLLSKKISSILVSILIKGENNPYIYKLRLLDNAVSNFQKHMKLLAQQEREPFLSKFLESIPSGSMREKAFAKISMLCGENSACLQLLNQSSKSS